MQIFSGIVIQDVKHHRDGVNGVVKIGCILDANFTWQHLIALDASYVCPVIGSSETRILLFQVFHYLIISATVNGRGLCRSEVKNKGKKYQVNIFHSFIFL